MTNNTTSPLDPSLSRRSLFAGAAVGSFVLAVQLSSAPLIAMVSEGTALAFEPSLFLSIASDGTVTILAHRSEMGTGIRTALPMVVADELGANWDRVVIEQAIGDRRLGSQNTDGSQSIRGSFDTMRTVGATARTMFEQAAAAQWKADPSECKGADHKVTHTPSGKTISYGDLVAAAAKLEVPDSKSLSFKPSSERTYIGKNVPITDMDVILTGQSVFGIDARREDQLYAVIARSPVLGAVPDSFDSDATMKVPGVVDVIEMPSTPGAPAFNALGGIAVLATSTWAAIRGRDALEIEWGASEHASFNSDRFEETLGQTARETGKVFRNDGDVDAAFADADEKHSLEADYYAPLLAHAPMEPPCAVAEVQMDDDGKVVHCDVWTATQNPQAAQGSVAGALGIPAEEVVVNVTLLGCGFGRKSKPDYVVEAALLARDLGQPVHVTWTREDDLRHDYYHAVSAMHMRAVVDDDGVPTAWLQRSAFTPIGSTFSKGAEDGGGGEMGMGFTPLPFAVPNLRVENGPGPAHVRIGWLRSVAHVYHAFAACSFADELAQRGGWDSYEYLMEVLLVEQDESACVM
jgi:isoquinoline 1-oxidoreductase beta subunit